MSEQKTIDIDVPASARQQEELGAFTPSEKSFVDEKEQPRHTDEEKEDGTKGLDRVESSVYPSGLKMFSILLGVVLSMFLVALDMTIVATAIPVSRLFTCVLRGTSVRKLGLLIRNLENYG